MIDKFSIIIPTLNEERYLPKLLHSISKQYFKGKLQVIIVDGHSEDKTIQIAKKFKYQLNDLLIIPSERGIATQRNAGVKEAKYPNLLFIDADMILPPYFFSILNKRVSTKGDFIYSFSMWAAGFNILDHLTMLFFYPVTVAIGSLEKFTPGGIMLTTKKVHEKIGGFRDGLLAEDIDFGKRAIAKGARYRLFLLPFAFHSVRRLRTMGRRKFIRYCLKSYVRLKKYGKLYLKDNSEYPFGHYKNG